ncbi:MAG: SDR family NAD(P)-dependent oxidoreductase [Acidimicrobiia bacterium]
MSSGDDVKGKVVVVGGATRGIGREAAFAFARAGARVVIVGRSTNDQPNRVMTGTLDEVLGLLQAAGADALAVRADLATAEGVDAVKRQVDERYGRCDVLVNNFAYSTDFGKALDIPVSKWNTSIKVNFLGPLMLTQAFAPSMLERGEGTVVNVSSGSSVHYVPGQLPYGAGKALLERFTTDLAVDYPDAGVKFVALRIDGAIPTETYLMVSGSIGITARGVPLTSPTELGEALVWIARQPSSVSGRIFTLGDLIDAGALPPPSTVL